MKSQVHCYIKKLFVGENKNYKEVSAVHCSNRLKYDPFLTLWPFLHVLYPNETLRVGGEGSGHQFPLGY